jgi:hypothetical protein
MRKKEMERVESINLSRNPEFMHKHRTVPDPELTLLLPHVFRASSAERWKSSYTQQSTEAIGTDGQEPTL